MFSYLADPDVGLARGDELQLVSIHDGEQLLAHVLRPLQGAVLCDERKV